VTGRFWRIGCFNSLNRHVAEDRGQKDVRSNRQTPRSSLDFSALPPRSLRLGGLNYDLRAITAEAQRTQS